MPLHHVLRLTSLAALLATVACSSDSSDDGAANPCEGLSNCVAFAAGASATSIGDAIATAAPGTTFAFAAGTFKLNLALDLTAANLTVRGAGKDATILDFTGQTGAYGIQATGDGFTIQDIQLLNPAGDGVKVVGADGVTFTGVKVVWDNPDLSTHGRYGLYPVQSQHVLIDGCYVAGSSDAGIYVGQSQHIIVKNSEATENVAGIEIENSYWADVHDNLVHGNTGGVLVFDLPGLPQQGGHDIRVFDNVIIGNNHPNFADPAGVVAQVPAGAGVTLMANANVEVFGNWIENNQTVAISAISYLLIGSSIPAGYNPFPSYVHVHDNTLRSNGTNPDASVTLGAVLAGIQDQVYFGAPLPEFIWDGISPPGTDPKTNPLGVCLESPMSWLSLGVQGPTTIVPWTAEPQFRCTLDPVEPVQPW